MTDHGYIDVSAWTGTWPFDLNGDVPVAHLAERLARVGIAESLVSPLAAVLAPDPMSANRDLLNACHVAGDLPVRFRPVPVINPVLATWRSDLASIVEEGSNEIAAIRLLPTWHGWDPDHPDATACLRAIAGHDLMPVIQARMVDERAMPVAAAPAMFDVEAVAEWLVAMPEMPVVLAGLYRTELIAVAELAHVAVDLSFVESEDTLATTLEVLPWRRVLLGTHAPLHEPLAAVAKLPAGGPAREAALRIGTESASDWLGLATTMYPCRTERSTA